MKKLFVISIVLILIASFGQLLMDGVVWILHKEDIFDEVATDALYSIFRHLGTMVVTIGLLLFVLAAYDPAVNHYFPKEEIDLTLDAETVNSDEEKK